MSNKTFTREYFLKEISQFHKFMGERSFWVGEKPRNAIKGLMHCYLNCNDLKEGDDILLDSALSEYDRRLMLVLTCGIYKEE